MNKVTYGCEYMMWRLFYQSTYNEYMAGQSKPPYGGVPAPVVRDSVGTPVEEGGAPSQPPKEQPTPAEKALPKAAEPQAAVEEPAQPKKPAAKPVKVIE